MGQRMMPLSNAEVMNTCENGHRWDLSSPICQDCGETAVPLSPSRKPPLSNAERQARYQQKRNLMLGKDPTMIRCLVKGNLESTIKACQDRYITANVVKIGTLETFLDVPSYHEDKLQRWFCEPAECDPGKGFPPGTLLFYSRGKES